MQLIQAFLLLSTISARVSAAKYTFWVDESCDDHTHFKGSLQDAFDMAKRSAERLESSTDKDYANVFSLVFGTDKSDQTQYEAPYGISIQLGHTNPEKPAKTTAYKIVHDIMKGIAEDWEQVEGEAARIASDLRIYCDNDARWKQSEINAEYWVDKLNKMFCKGPPGCGSPKTAGMVYAAHLKKHNEPTKEDPNPVNHKIPRNTMTICDQLLTTKERNPDLPISLTEVKDEMKQKKKDLTQLRSGIQDFRYMTSLTILHEFAHTKPYWTADVKEDGIDPYDWPNIIQKSPKNALRNADHFAYMGLWAYLADLGTDGQGYSCPRKKKRDDSEIKEGKLALLTKITKRWTSRLARYIKE